jgi:hypothetical protein
LTEKLIELSRKQERPTGLEWLAVLIACAVASVAATLWSWQQGAMLNYGDAVSHLHIARRVLDSRQAGLSQFGSVWLPLPHLLMLPFVQIYSWWANGAAALIPSMLAYWTGCVGLYRLARRWLSPQASAVALIFFAANPNLLYLQTTAMTEPLFVCEMIWVVVWMVEWRTALDDDPENAHRWLGWIALALIAAVYTRYDGWIMELIAWTDIGFALLRRRRLRPGTTGATTFWLVSLFIVAAPLSWFFYNYRYYGDWLEFMRGPYSAKAIEERTARPGGPPHPGWHNMWVSLRYFVKCAVMDAIAFGWGYFLLTLSLLGTAWTWVKARRRAFSWALLLWLPMPFYAYSVAYGSVPIFLPPWFPHSWYNTRYGMELLPALALGIGTAAQLLLGVIKEFKPREGQARWIHCTTGLMVLLLALNVYVMVRQHPLTYVEGTKNLQARVAFEQQIPPVMKAELARHPGGLVLMKTGIYPRLVELTGIPLRQTINEDESGYYEAALADPAGHAALVLAFDGDDVDQAVKTHPCGLVAIGRFYSRSQAPGTLYRTEKSAAQNLGNSSCAVVGSGKE